MLLIVKFINVYLTYVNGLFSVLIMKIFHNIPYIEDTEEKFTNYYTYQKKKFINLN